MYGEGVVGVGVLRLSTHAGVAPLIVVCPDLYGINKVVFAGIS